MNESRFLANGNVLEIVVSNVDVIRNDWVSAGGESKIRVGADESKGAQSSAGTMEDVFRDHEFTSLGESEVGSREILLDVYDKAVNFHGRPVFRETDQAIPSGSAGFFSHSRQGGS